MPTMYQTSISNILSFKVLLISSSVLSAAIMLTTTDFAFYIPSIYNGLISWLRPPYLYLVINCIIISIVASSKLQSNKDDASPSPITPSLGIVPPPPVKSVGTGFSTAEYKYSSTVLNDSSGYEVMNKEEKVLDIDTYEQVDAARKEDLPFVVNSDNGGVVAVGEDATSNKENEFVVAKSMWNASENVDLREYSPTSVKPPVSARFSHRRNVKASPEGGRTVLGVSKPKKQDTLESTWKTITEGRSIPITRHLKKSDTWERDSRVHGHHPHPHQQEKTMKKAETFKDRTTNTGSPSPLSGGGSGKLRKEPSLSQDELNRRVEAFIKKFNEDMRLQRQESLNQYMEMINRGSH